MRKDSLKPIASRVDEFELLAKAVARDEVVFSPRHLTGNDRRTHVRQTIREDHHVRITGDNAEARKKFKKLAGSRFAFFRGTALLFYRDMAGEDGWMPTVLTLGDVHPENFGVMPNVNDVPIFAVNDFDDAYYAPFTWDLKRGAAGFMIAAKEVAEFGGNLQRKIAAKFVKGYISGMRQYAEQSTEARFEMGVDNAPRLIRRLIEDAQKSRQKWLKNKYLDENGNGFRTNRKLVPISNRREEFQELINAMATDGRIDAPARAGNLRVKDVAIRNGQGTASLGLPRYYLLIEGSNHDGSHDLIIEFKRARRSAMAGLTPPTRHQLDKEGERIAHAQSVHLVQGDRFFSHLELDGKSFISRERAPYRDDISLESLSKKQWKSYAKICGQSLAHAHAMSDESGNLDKDIEPLILAAMDPSKLFVDDVLRFAKSAVRRIKNDHKHYKKDYKLGAFSTVDVVYE